MRVCKGSSDHLHMCVYVQVFCIVNERPGVPPFKLVVVQHSAIRKERLYHFFFPLFLFLLLHSGAGARVHLRHLLLRTMLWTLSKANACASAARGAVREKNAEVRMWVSRTLLEAGDTNK